MAGMSALADIFGAIAADVTLVSPGEAQLSTGERVSFGAQAAGLTELLYARHYCRPSPEPEAAAPDPAAFLQALAAANPLPPRFESWTIVQADPAGLLLAGAGGAQRRAGLAEVVPGPGGLVPGQTVRVPAPREMVTAGHYALLGRPVCDARSGRQVRFYWNLPADGATAFLAGLGAALDRRRIPFQAKVPLAASGFGRTDAGVLYLADEDVEAAADVIAAMRAALALRPETPLFARRLAPGLAFAESPQSGESFGMHRCRLCAEGLLQAFSGGLSPEEVMLARFIAYGLDPAAPERNPATSYPYPFEALAA
jgi:hypothetical protein